MKYKKLKSIYPLQFWACKLQCLMISAVTDAEQTYAVYKRYKVIESMAPHLLIMSDMLFKVPYFLSF
jgi:hypothetical protein